MNLKKLTQAVFDGLPSEYHFAIVGKGGVAAAHTKDPFALVDESRWNTAQGSLSMLIGYGFDDSDWQNSKIERQNVPTAADIDWSRQDVPAGATHCVPTSAAKYWYKKIGDKFYAYNGTGWNTNHTSEKCVSMREIFEIKRKESIHDVARSIEAARVAEQSERTYPHYFKDVSGVDAIDLYHVARLYDITDPALFHAFKKIACAGKRGAKDQAQDVQEAIDALQRWRELNV